MPPSCNGHVPPKSDLPLQKSPAPPSFRQEDTVYAILLTLEWEEHICATLTPSQRLAEEAWAQGVCPPESAIPKCYKDFADVFSEEAFAHLPPHKAWDHAIELHPDAKLPRGRTFPLSPTEQKELDAFLREFGQQTNPSVKISDWSSCVLCQEEGSLPPSGAGLPEVERDHGEKLLPASASLRRAHQTMQCRVVHYLGPLLGLQQCLTDGRG